MSEDPNLLRGVAISQGSMPPRPIDRERVARLQLSALTGDDTEFFNTIGAILNDDTGPNRFSAIFSTIAILVIELNELHVSVEDQEEVERVLRADLLGSLRGEE